jgi:hypothetical protein
VRTAPNLLIVEGDDDIHVLIRFVEALGFGKVPEAAKLEKFASKRKREHSEEETRVAYVSGSAGENADGATGKAAALDRLRDELKSGNRSGIAIIVDADNNLAGTWDSVRDAAGLASGVTLPGDGFVGRVGDTSLVFGCWVMPDNVRQGTLEDLLLSLAEREEGIKHARGVVQSLPAGVRPVQVSPSFESKSTLHTWLAWQAEPGPRPSVAITRRLLSLESVAAQSLMGWLDRWLRETETGVQE